jgi:Lipoprotein LpqB beta-propeller domain/Sporulation and spore germination
VSWAKCRLAAVFIVLASLFAAAGCVSIPTTGPIEKVEEGQQPPCCVNVELTPPLAGDGSKQIVEGYLRANNNYQPNYGVARQFLTRMAAEKWSPEAGVSIYDGSLTATKEAADRATVELKGRLVGSLAKDRTYIARDEPLNQSFGLKKENGEWRIDTLPSGLWVDEFYFTRFYQAYDLYFVGNGTSLVPDPIYLPGLRNPANVASALIKALLKGPSEWLKPAVTSAIPPNTNLSVDSVTITDGIAEVPLSDSVLALPDQQRSLLAAQIVYTLQQVGGVKGVLIKVNQQPFRVPGSDPNSLVVFVDAIPRGVDPIPSVAGEQLYAVQQGAVKVVNPTADSPTISPMEGPLARPTSPVNQLAVSMANTDLAVTTDDGTTLRRAPIGPGQSTPLLNGKRDLLRPQFTRYGEIWDIGRQDGRQRIWIFAAESDDPIEIDSPVVQDGKVTAFRISPDGTRMALVRSTGTGQELGLARIIRSKKPSKSALNAVQIMVDEWRTLNTTQTTKPPAIRRIRDVAWLNATELLVLGAPDARTAYAPFRVTGDASQITAQGEVESSDPRELAVLPQTQSAIIVGGDGRTWKDNRSQWMPFLDQDNKISAIAYPG